MDWTISEHDGNLRTVIGNLCTKKMLCYVRMLLIQGVVLGVMNGESVSIVNIIRGMA